MNCKQIIISCILLLIPIGLLLSFIYGIVNQDAGCDDKKTTCIIERIDGNCNWRYNGTKYSDYSECSTSAEECLDDDPIKYNECYKDDGYDCPRYRCINGPMIGLTIGSILGMAFCSVPAMFYIMYSRKKTIFNKENQSNNTLDDSDDLYDNDTILVSLDKQ